jgi:glycosyltransferase involved in cell wall biosynthesis
LFAIVDIAPSDLRVLHVIPGGGSAASMIFAKREVAALAREGISCKTFYLQSRTSPIVMAGEWRRLRREVSAFSSHLVHAEYGTVTALICVLAVRQPVVVTYRGIELNPCPGVPWVRSALGRILSQVAALGARRIICVSDEVRRRLWWRRDVASVIPSGVDTNLFFPRPRAEARRELGWLRAERIVLFNSGGDTKIKRFDLASAAVEVARSRIGPVTLVILDGTIDPVRVPLFLNGADCLLCTSDSEGSPDIVKEALACNLPVVSVDVGDVRERLQGVSPSHVVERTPEALGAALAYTLQHPARSNGTEAIRSVTQQLSCQKIISVYRSALGHV